MLNSEGYSKFKSLAEHEAKFRKLNTSFEDLKKEVRAGILSNPTTRPKINQLKKLENELELLTRKRALFQRREDVTWVREQTLRYLDSRPAATQKPEDISKFLEELSKLQQQYNFELTQSEALQLANHRPEVIEIQVIIEHYYDRVPSQEAQDAIYELCQTLPEAPVVDLNESGIPIDSLDDDSIDDDVVAQEEMALDDDQLDALEDENEFNINARDQTDHDVDVPMEDDD